MKNIKHGSILEKAGKLADRGYVKGRKGRHVKELTLCWDLNAEETAM